jgi:branched-chain amino acid transport system permease protein
MSTGDANTSGAATDERRGDDSFDGLDFEAVRERPTLAELRAAVRLTPKRVLGLFGLLALALVPLAASLTDLIELIGLLYLILFAMSWDAVSGYTGQLSLGHAFFFGLGGYTTTVANVQHGLSPALSIPLGVLVAVLGGLLIGVPALRIRGPYLALVTLIAPIILLQLFVLFSSRLPALAPAGLKGQNGFATSPDAVVGSGSEALIQIEGFRAALLGQYYLSFALLVVVLAALLAVTRSSAGSVFTAIREDERAVSAAGLNPAKFKIFAFTLSAAVGGLAGAMFVHTTAGGAQPSQLLEVLVSVRVIILVVLGGMGTIVGGIVGGVFFLLTTLALGAASDAVGTLPVLNTSISNLRPVPLLSIALVTVIFAPRGILGLFDRLWARHVTGESVPDRETAPLRQVVRHYRRQIRRTGVFGDDDRP